MDRRDADILNENCDIDLDDVQRRIDAIAWYHEFEFPNGLIA